MTNEDIKKELGDLLTLCHMNAEELVRFGELGEGVLGDDTLFYRTKCELLHYKMGELYKRI